jgi:hypothetical protein
VRTLTFHKPGHTLLRENVYIAKTGSGRASESGLRLICANRSTNQH